MELTKVDWMTNSGGIPSSGLDIWNFGGQFQVESKPQSELNSTKSGRFGILPMLGVSNLAMEVCPSVGYGKLLYSYMDNLQ
jgi:hypothetical protein